MFTISGIQNPERGQLRTKGLEMGAQYRPDWTADCTLLVCAFLGTPKFKEIQAKGGSIVSKDWILECYKQRKLVDFERFVLNKGRPWRVLGDRGRSLKQKKVNCGTAQEIQKWAQDDLKLIINWLQEQDAKPGPEELESVGAQGILVCLEDAVKSLAENQGLSSVIENWGFLPKAVKELAAIEKGVTEISSSTLEEAERLKGIYDETLKDVLGSRKSANSSEQMKGGVEEGEVDDDATEVMSDINSQETVDYNSDDTIVMEPEAIDECTKKLMQRFVGMTRLRIPQ